MKTLIADVLFTFCTFPLWAQGNTISVYTGGDRFYDVLSQPDRKFNLLGIKYEHAITKNLTASFKYMSVARFFGLEVMVTERWFTDRSSHGMLSERLEYNFFDLEMGYRSHLGKKVRITTSLGPSYAYGENLYPIHTDPTPRPAHVTPDDVYYGILVYRKEGYWGMSGNVAFDYLLWKKINAGVDFSARYYTNDFPFSINYGVHLGYSF